MVAALIALTPDAASAAALDWLDGEWCSQAGERMIVEPTGIGFNEHTICSWPPDRPSGERIDIRITCENVYPGENGEVVRTDRETLRLRAVKTGPQTISVRIRDAPATAFAKC